MIAATAKSTEIPLNKIFTSRKANDWIQKAAKHRTPKKLFGDYWHEGEIALLFSDAGAGKSLLAVQIADAIAGGRQVPPILTSVRAQNVLYLDFKHSDKQFESRYVGSDGKHYRFQERFYRVEADPNAVNRADLLPAIERLIEETKTKVLIIDNVTYLKRKYNGWDDQLELIRWLRQLKIRKGVSILLLAPIQRRGGKRALQLADLRGTSMLGDFADSVFAIGRCGGSESGRYLKLLKGANGFEGNDPGRVRSFTIKRMDDNYLGFYRSRIASESAHLMDTPQQRDEEIIERVDQMTKDGFSLRAIEAELGIPKSNVHRVVNHVKRMREREVAEEAMLERAAAEEEERRLREEELARERESLPEPAEDAPEGGAQQFERQPRECESLTQEESPPKYRVELPERSHPDYPIQAENNDPRHLGLVRVIDPYGKDMFVEQFWPNGRPSVWYSYNKQGRGTRWTYDGWGASGEWIPETEPAAVADG